MKKISHILLLAGLLLAALPAHSQTISGEVYGGGHYGKVTGSTSVYISSGVLGNDSLINSPNGGVFGAGEGDSAIVKGNTLVCIAGGTFHNNIYGGGKHADLEGNANVDVFGGVIRVNVYGGSRLADVDGYTYVYVHDSTGTTESPVLNNVYGGNDIGGNVNNTGHKAPAFYTALSGSDRPTSTPKTFVRIGQKDAGKQPYIGNVYGGSDGGYIYVPTTTGYDITLENNYFDWRKGRTVVSVKTKPTLSSTYLKFDGGTVGNMFAGGDNVTVTDSADICLTSSAASKLVSATIPKKYILRECAGGDSTYAFLDEFAAADYTVKDDSVTFKYEINRCFGGNNNADMAIRPGWHLSSANVNNLYSGGNKGDMTYKNGILITVEGAGMQVQNVFGGCRLSDVHPSQVVAAETLEGFEFPAGYAARVLIKGGKIHNVYGGNDISGAVYYGAHVVIHSDIINNVYGSGNGSYAYHTNNNDRESDYFYQTNGLTGTEAINVLNNHRPNAENVLVELAGTKNDTTFIAGSVFCGGNSATLRDLTGDLEYAKAKLKIGSYVVANNVFLGSNGENMLTDSIIRNFNDNTLNPGIDLTEHEHMMEYMKGVEVAIRPEVVFDDNYVAYSTNIGSLYCGGNKGSMSAAGTFNIDFLKSVKIFDKLVAGCNDANVAYKNDSTGTNGAKNPLYNHSYVLGGLTTETHPKVQLNISGVRLEPKKITYDAEGSNFSFEWNHYQGDSLTEDDMADYAGYMHGGNIYGGCYNSGYVNGDVQINITKNVTTEEFFNHLERESVTIGGTTYNYSWDEHLFEPFISLLTCYGGGYGSETEIWGNTTVNITDSARIMKVRGGGEWGWVGKMKRNATTGVIETSSEKFNSYYWSDSTKYYPVSKMAVEQAYDATVHLDAKIIEATVRKPDGSDTTGVANNVAEMCGGGFRGAVTGNTHAIVDDGCVYTVFGGASNANIYGHAETLIGQNGFPYVSQTVYGGNDFGGLIMGTEVYDTKNTTPGSIQKVKCNTYVEYFSGEIGYNTGELYTPDSVSAAFGIFGGGYGEYDYRTSRANGNIKYMGKDGRAKTTAQPNLLGKITINDGEADFAANCFVNISSKSTDSKDRIGRIFGGGQGLPGQNGVANSRQTYLLFNAANANARPDFLAQYVFGAGDCTTTWYSLLDAYSGNAHHIFGACRGVSYIQEVETAQSTAKAPQSAAPQTAIVGNGLNNAPSSNAQVAGKIQNLSYMGEVSTMNLYPTMIAPEMEVFASGAFSGTKETYLNLYGGHVAEVYGASFQEGVTYLTQVNVPEGSTLRCNAIYGGGKGDNEEHPCDTYLSTIQYHSEDATVEEGIYGGNRDYRFTRRVMIQIDVPVWNSKGELVDVYGGGKGEHTLTEITYVSLDDGARVKNVYGGSCEGAIYNKPSVIQYMLTKDYYRDKYLYSDTHSYDSCFCLGDCEIRGFNTWKAQEGVAERTLFPNSGYDMTIGTLAPTSMGHTAEVYEYNADVQIRKGAVVTGNAYGGGYGPKAVTAGGAAVHLIGGTVMGNIYGGGYGGPVKDTLCIAGTMLKDVKDHDVVGPMAMNTYTKVYLEGGSCTNSYGSGREGNVFGDTYTYVGKESCGAEAAITYYSGDPTVTRSIYGGGEQGAVYYATNYGSTTDPKAYIDSTGTAFIEMYNGHVGYTYDASATVDSLKYVMNIDYQTAADSVLYNNGNVFGGGYGEDANTIKTKIMLTGGTIRNSLYGGGEIATIGQGQVHFASDGVTRILDTITTPGETHIYMYGGHVLRDVFGGGRGYSYNLKGDEVVGTKFYADGFVFGKTDVNIYRGEIGTADKASLNLGYGNVFGGGNVGYVYSAEGTKWTEESDDKHTKGYYYKKNTDILTEDCSVLISPYTKVTADSVKVNGKTYTQCAYVPTDQLNYLLGKTNPTDSAIWEKMDYKTGVTVHNAVFAGGNVTRGDSKLYADTKTVLGNAVAVLNDIYHRDLISIGTEHTGGIYGDGNLTKVDGFREIGIVNYGTDYYGLKEEITTAEYYALNDRERAYFQLKYKCKTAYDKYVVDQQITEEVYRKMDESEQQNWTQAGFCSVYAGRLLNTIQRADFVGVHGSRIVLQGAEDRTVSVVDYMEYAINRVGEVSLNQKESVITSGESSEATHGNYFGFYSTVNYLESLTSDVDFNSVRTTTSGTHPAEGDSTYYNYKKANLTETWRNNATSMNKVALNSGVYLEIVSQESTDSAKVYGPITGVVELDLIDLGENIGGAFVYAKNIHGVRSGSMNTHAHISSYNDGAVTHSGFIYDDSDQGLETSGNFVHPAKPIIDDCYPGSADVTSPGHYWFLRGSIYLYDQYISAYTGASTAYKADVQIPLTITAGSHGRLKILTIQPNLYAYYNKSMAKLSPEGEGQGVVVNGTTYYLNDVVTYWDWSQMSATEQQMFVHDTYIVMQNFKYLALTGTDTVYVSKGDVWLESEYKALVDRCDSVYVDGEKVPTTQAIRISNATSHTNGYALTADISNPAEWDDRYITQTGSTIITKSKYDSLSVNDKKLYLVGPSYHAAAGVYGQSYYYVGDIVNDEIHGDYTGLPDSIRSKESQATVDTAFITTAEVTYSYNGVQRILTAGVGVSKVEKDSIYKVQSNVGKLDTAYVCNGTLEIQDDYIITGELISKARYDDLSADDKTQFSRAWMCTKEGYYGGAEYKGDTNYDAIKGWCDLTADDRGRFTFNYDALDLFLNDLAPDSTIASYDKDKSNPYYARTIELDYSAKCRVATTYRAKDASSDSSYTVGQLINRTQYEAVPNEMIHYAYLKAWANVPVYVANKDFTYGGWPYAAGDTIAPETWANMSGEYRANVDSLKFSEDGTYYYCKDKYLAGGQGTVEGKNSSVINVYGTTKTYNVNDSVPVGVIIAKTDYNELPNLQNNFTITGVSPVETSTLYVSRDASMSDVLQDRIITLIYQYQYDESTTDNQMSTVTERHVVNIHLLFRSGAPSIGRLRVPGAVLPGTAVGLKQPVVNKGAYEILGGGWEIYTNETDADNHINGQPYNNNKSVLYFYQTGQYVSYYAKTYLGKTYSNAVPLEVANYHSINDVMADSTNHMYIYHPDVPRNCKIYIDGDDSQDDESRNELDLLHDLYYLSLNSDSMGGTFIRGCRNLDFILQEDVSPKKYTDWTPLGKSESDCFGDNGFFHGDGHVITGLNNALFDYYCGSIYNTGVRGTFEGAGIAKTSGEYAACCWVWNEDTLHHSGNPVFGNGSDANLYNCYYWEEDNASSSHKYTAIAGKLYRKNETAFNNGEVAYDLNRYYLVKRYHDNTATPSGAEKLYSYWTVNSGNNLVRHDKQGYYSNDEAKFEVYKTNLDYTIDTFNVSYVEKRFWDGDFVYADGQLHTSVDERYYDGCYYPIYPDDYIYFGQKLNYGYIGGMTHVMYPHSVARTDANRLLLTNAYSNRVYRAPVYKGTMTKEVAHYNVSCILPTTYKKELSSRTSVVVQTPSEHGISIIMSGTDITTQTETLANDTIQTTVTTQVDDMGKQTRTITTVVTKSLPTDVYPGLTAIDYTGYNDYDYAKEISHDVFFTPILDHHTLIDFANPDQSRNMLVYSNSDTDEQGYNVLSAYLYEPNLIFTSSSYRNITKVNSSVSNAVQGHLIEKTDGKYVTDRNHFLVDENDFHCPIPYRMGSENRMWYQRTPCTFSSGNNGFESIVLPFTAVLVSAHQKGEITHFYDNEKNNHEYWLRGFKGVESDGTTLKFIRPMGGSSDEGYDSRYVKSGTGAKSYMVGNDFLYDYYYSNSSGQDENKDTYQQTYYKDVRTYDNYIYLTANVPYLMAFPGKKFYEFDMSGEFVPGNTMATISKLDIQNVSFCSDTSAVIDTLHVGDLETSVSGCSYKYVGIFQATDTATLDAQNARVINNAGDKFVERQHVYADTMLLTKMQPFHAYLISSSSSPTKGSFGIGSDAPFEESYEAPSGQLEISSKNREIRIESHLEDEITVRIINATGITMDVRTISPEETVFIPVDLPGVYLVNSHKILVK